MLNKQNIISGLVITGIVLLVNVYDTNASSLGITKDDILNILLSQEGQIDDFSFSFTMEHTINYNGKVTRTHKEISLFTKGDLFRTRKQTFLCENAEKKLMVDTETSADGQIVYLLDRVSMTGEVETKSPKEAGVGQNWGSHYAEPTLRKPRRRGNRGYEGNLIAALEEDYDNIKLLDKSELFEGRNTIVLERPGYCRIYLDPTINFAVVGLESIGEIEFRAVNSEFKEVRKGFWLPMHMEMSQKRNNQAEKKQLQITDLKVNSGLTAKDFKIEFPKGVRIYDKNIGMLLPPNQSGVSDEYLDEVLKTAFDRKMVDVNHVSSVRSRQVKNSSEDIIANKMVVAENATDKELHVIADSKEPQRWKKIVTISMLVFTVLLLLAYWLHRRVLLTKQRR